MVKSGSKEARRGRSRRLAQPSDPSRAAARARHLFRGERGRRPDPAPVRRAGGGQPVGPDADRSRSRHRDRSVHAGRSGVAHDDQGPAGPGRSSSTRAPRRSACPPPVRRRWTPPARWSRPPTSGSWHCCPRASATASSICCPSWPARPTRPPTRPRPRPAPPRRPAREAKKLEKLAKKADKPAKAGQGAEGRKARPSSPKAKKAKSAGAGLTDPLGREGLSDAGR